MIPKAHRKVGDSIQSAGEGAYLTGHIKPTGMKCYRLLTADHRPIGNISAALIMRMKSRDYLTDVDGRLGKVLILSDSYKAELEKSKNRKQKKIEKQP